MRYSDDPEASRSVSTRLEARNSLRRHKATSDYKKLLKTTISDSAKLEAQAGNEHEKRTVRLDRFNASLEVEKLAAGIALDEFSGLLALPDPLRAEVYA